MNKTFNYLTTCHEWCFLWGLLDRPSARSLLVTLGACKKSKAVICSCVQFSRVLQGLLFLILFSSFPGLFRL